MDNLSNKIKEIEAKLAEAKKRIPYHSIQPYLIMELEELEEELEILLQKYSIEKQ